MIAKSWQTSSAAFLSKKPIFIKILVIAAAVMTGLLFGSFIHLKWIGGNSLMQVRQLDENISIQQFKNADFDYILIGNTRCSYCKDGVQFLDSLGVRYRVIYLDKEPSGRVFHEKLGAEGVPVLISKKQFIVGFGRDAWLGLIKGTSVGAVN